MSVYEISTELAQFILEKFDSVAQLEALLLCRENPASDWSAEVVAQRLYIDEKQAKEVLVRLQAQGLLGVKPVDPSQYFYDPRSPELKALVGQLAEIYSKQLVPVTNLIHSRPKTRIQQFADAFRLREKDKP